MDIRPAREADLNRILEIYESARAYMRRSGNLQQWTGGYPSRAVVLEDLAREQLYVCTEGEELLGVFCFFLGEDPTYLRIDGAWMDDAPYGVIHRIAVSEHAHGRGVAAACFAYAFERAGNLKIDTHRDNLPMQKALGKNGFSYCGIIYLQNGEPRMAYQKNGGRRAPEATADGRTE